MLPVYAAAIQGASNVLGQTLGGPAAPQVADSGRGMFDQWFDGSGWTVATGGGDARALPTMTSAVQQTADNAMSLLNNPMVLIAAVMAVYLARRQ